MNTFKNVLANLQATIPKAILKHTVSFVFKDEHRWEIKVSKPCPFDDYGDVVAQVTLYKDNEIVSQTLITYDTDLDGFCKKLLKRIKEG